MNSRTIMAACAAAALLTVCVSGPAEARKRQRVQPAYPAAQAAQECFTDESRPGARKICGGAQATAQAPRRHAQKGKAREAPRATQTAQERPAAAPANVVRSRSGATARVAQSAAPAFQRLVNWLDARGYPIRFMGGIRPGRCWTGRMHPCGTAIDINQTRYGVVVARFPEGTEAEARRLGLSPGSGWCNPDTGHFQVGGHDGCARVSKGNQLRKYGERLKQQAATARARTKVGGRPVAALSQRSESAQGSVVR